MTALILGPAVSILLSGPAWLLPAEGPLASVRPGSPGESQQPATVLKKELARVAQDAYEDASLEQLTVLVAQGDSVRLEASWSRTGETPDASAPFPIGTLNTTLLAQSILTLAADEKLELEQPLSERFEDWPYADEAITLGHLLAQTSGLPSIDDLAPIAARTRADVLEHWSDVPLESTPGSCVRYSNSNDLVLGWILEDVTGQTVPDSFGRSIFEPLEMSDSGHGIPDDAQAVEAGWVQEVAGALEPSQEAVCGAQALHSTARDLLRWISAVRDCTELDESVCAGLTTPGYLNDGSRASYARGFSMIQLADQAGYACGGGSEASRVHVACYPDSGLVVVVLAQGVAAPAAWIERRLARVVFEVPDTELHDYPLEASECRPYLGEYTVGCTQYTIVVRDGRLHVSLPDGRSLGLAYQGAHVFVAQLDPQLRLSFQLSEKGIVTSFLLSEQGSETEAIRWR